MSRIIFFNNKPRRPHGIIHLVVKSYKSFIFNFESHLLKFTVRNYFIISLAAWTTWDHSSGGRKLKKFYFSIFDHIGNNLLSRIIF